jgi:hypothetical protein
MIPHMSFPSAQTICAIIRPGYEGRHNMMTFDKIETPRNIRFEHDWIENADFRRNAR